MLVIFILISSLKRCSPFVVVVLPHVQQGFHLAVGPVRGPPVFLVVACHEFHIAAAAAVVVVVVALLLGDALSLQLLQNVVQVARVGVAVARQVGAELRLVVHLVPDDRVRLARGAGRTHGENEPAVPRHQKKPQNLDGETEKEKMTLSHCRTLQAAVLVAIVVHGDEALEVVLVATLCEAAHGLGPGDATHAGAFVARRPGQGLHADGAVLTRGDEYES
ncbi:hypothetical protein EYF80_021832 [Liparis tanakae]|uniref:Uncharacterized protein n=1 Tax=Liparis tanakae TaxID=230148 RepID=A0A4Z2HS99_9TELE|nr:hypothetical protein EYF80_021832 [Liparis tanakae]